ncbi:bifunctional metallophosphatase/5'-nucleotidase [Paenibacillus sp. N3/727]|uniref:bifunctional metallophosphatase/5'-nucleotidase n=1 Tax=Paenibacillus sp. N3/727 TaxID=2925845 RepID=UPI001F533527|nr:bifunctional metallophosphatase/5'-nucleotidase [Paenibacillus sp. N3/727]UNK19256.1 bifunctional metallophosphatase/5'-nucleotidase [Paenibacillus sp. N3/727]
MEDNHQITCEILVTSDIHGHIYPTDYRTREERNFGLAKIATMIRAERLRAPELLLVDNGDLIQGTPLAAYALKHRDGVYPAVTVLNELHYNAAVLGNHEFNYGMDLLKRVIGESDFPWLSAGIVDSETGEPAFGKPYIVKVVGNEVKVAILGVTTHYIPHWENPAHIQGLQFRDALETVRAWVPRIRREEQPDLLVVTYHGGFERELLTGDPAKRLTSENQAYVMCMEVDGIDVLITGHQHRLLAGQAGGVTIVQPGCNGQALGRITVDFARKAEGGWRIQEKRAELLIPDETVEADDTVLELTREIETETQDWLDRPIGHVIGDLTISDPLACRSADHPFIEFVNKVQMDVAGVEVSNTALLNNESAGFGPVITMRDVLTNFMYPNTLTVLRLTGRDIRAALEQTAAYFMLDSGGRLGVSPAYLEPKAQHYNYDMWEGIEYELDVSRPIGRRVVKLSRGGAALTEEMELDVVMNNYRAGGGGDYDMYNGKPVIREIQIDMSDLVTDYIVKQGTITATCNSNWRVIAGR